ncbi:MAG: hypothetical protein R3B70_36520 [Polyangiaceae bacterium]
MNMTLDVRRQAMKSVLFPFTFGLSARAGRTVLLGSLALLAGAGCDPADPSSDSPGSDDAQPAAAAQAGPARVIERLSALRGEPVVAASKTTGVRADIGSAAEGVHLRDEASGAGVRVRVAGASAAGGEGEEVDGAVVYPGAGPGGSDLVMVPTASGVEDWVLLEKAPARASIGYALALEDVAGLRLVAGVLELLDASGAPRLRARAPYLVDSAGARHAARFELVDCKADTSAAAPWGRSVTAPGRDTCHLEVTWKGANVAYPAALDPVWEATTGSLAKGRRSHTATQLGADTASPVLLAGGFDGSSAVAVAELYQPKSRTFAATGTLSTARGAHAAVQLQDGRVLVAGGAGAVNATATGDDTSGEVGSLEVYSPITGLWSAGAGTLTPPRANLTATLLGSGKVLLAGGQDNLGQPLKATAIYDPSLPSLDNGGPQLAAARSGHTATAIDANRVLIVGGFANVDANSLNSTEIYSATTGAITAGPAMIFSRAYHSATVIAGNKILLAGGISKPNDPANAKIHETTEIYTPGAGAGTLAQGPSMTKERAYHAAARLATGFVVVSGGFGGDTVAGSAHEPRPESDLYDPTLNKFTAGPDMGTARLFHTLTSVNPAGSVVDGVALPAEAVIAVGGTAVQGANDPALTSAELLLRPLADTCSIDLECASGHCSDGVCCNEACANECDSCEASLKQSGAASGTCGPSKEGVAQGKQLVDGPDLGTQCAANVVSFYTCDGAGNKSIYYAESCNGNTCDVDGVKCIETCNDVTTKCLSDAWCDIPAGEVEGKCTPKRDLGETCEEGRQCKNPNDLSVDGFCVDGVCCNTTCTEICQACNVGGLAGTCSHAGTNFRREPVGDRKCVHQTPAGDEICAGFCDVTVSPSVTDCQYPTKQVLCGDEKTCTCEDNDACIDGPATQARFACDAQGACEASPVQDDGTSAYVTDCGGHICGPVADNGHQQCATTCAADAECLIDFFCQLPAGQPAGTCEPLPDTGRCDGEHTLRVPFADDIDCSPYLCPEGETACRTSCASDLECVEPGDPGENQVTCNPDGKCEAPPAPPTLPSCSLPRDTGSSSSSGAAAALVMLLGVLVHRRRRRA